MEGMNDVLAMGAFFVLNGVVGMMSFRDYLEKKRVVDKLEKAPTFNNAVEIHSIFDKTGQTTIPYALVHGRILATERSVDGSDGSRGIYRHFSIKQHDKIRHREGNWSNETITVQEDHKSLPFGIIEPFLKEGEGAPWIIHNIQRPLPENALSKLSTIVQHRYDPTGETLGTKDGERIIAATEKTEKMIRNYTMVTLSGKIVVDGMGRVELSLPAMGEPFVAHTGSINEVLDSHRSLRDIMFAVCCVSGVVAICVGGAIAYRIWRSNRRSKPSDDEDYYY